MCHTGGEPFKRRLVHSVALTISFDFVPLLKSFIANVKCKARLKAKFKCVCFTMCSLVMNPLSRDCMKIEIDQFKYQF